MFFLWSVFLSLLASTLGNSHCDEIPCSNVNDYVCAIMETLDGSEIVVKYQNICFLRQKQCQLREYVVIFEVQHKYCHIVKGNLGTTPMPDYQNNPQVEALRSLKILQDGPFTEKSRYSNGTNRQLWELVGRLFGKLLERVKPQLFLSNKKVTPPVEIVSGVKLNKKL